MHRRGTGVRGRGKVTVGSAETFREQRVQGMVESARKNAELRESLQKRRRRVCMVSIIRVSPVVVRWLTALY